MKREILCCSIFLMGLLSGCAEVMPPEPGMESSQACPIEQVYVKGRCYDTCSINKPCKGMFVCVGVLCEPAEMECTPDTRRCSSDKISVEYCADGSGYTVEKICEADETCENSICVKNACEDGTMRCRNNNVEICYNSSFTVYDECVTPQICTEDSFECEIPAECFNDDRRCDANGNIQICNDEHWVAFQTCPSGTACDTASLECVETAVCENGTFKCNGDTVFACANAQWIRQKDCEEEGQICQGGACVMSNCQDGDTRCFEVNSSHFVQVCHNNAWESTKCDGGEVCTETGTEAKCIQNSCASQYKCENNVLFKCDGNDYAELKACGTSQYCDATSASCKDKCGNGVLDLDNGEECDGTAIRKDLSCQSKVANTSGSLKCTKECTVDASGCTLSCNTGTSECNGSIYKTCVSGTWQVTNCADTGMACGESGCYKPSISGDWDVIQDFEELPDNPTTNTSVYTMEYNYSDKYKVTWKLRGRTNMNNGSDNYSLSGQGFIVRKENSNYIVAENITGGIGQLAFDWRSWPNDTGKVTIEIGDKKETLSFAGESEKQVFQLDINDASATSVTITPISGKRFIIDNIRWTKKK